MGREPPARAGTVAMVDEAAGGGVVEGRLRVGDLESTPFGHRVELGEQPHSQREEHQRQRG